MKKQSITLEKPIESGDPVQELTKVLEAGGYNSFVISPGKDPVKEKVKNPAKVPVKEAAPGPDLEWKDRDKSPEDRSLEWKKKDVKIKTTVIRCLVIDRNDRWHENAQVDLHDTDTGGFTWGYYGTSYPVLVEDDEGKLHPWYLPDAVGESSNRLYKGANPEGFRNTFRHRSTTLQKIQVGLMVVLALGLFFIMFVLINQ